MRTEDHRPAPGLYLHVPFCVRKCPYCGFASEVAPELHAAFPDAVRREAALRAAGPGPGPAAFDTLYLGGGTPSVLGDDALEAILTGLRAIFSFAKDTEVTLEVNPGDLNRARLSRLRALGINRLSLGVQSFDDRVLRFLGRRHDAEAARAGLRAAREAGFDNLGIDLIDAFRGQTWDDLRRDLEAAMEFSPTHLSCYQLTVEPATPFAHRHAADPVTAPEEQQAELFLSLSDFLRERGWLHYEVSNFARSEPFRSRHNRKYWAQVPTLGLGPAAHGFDGSCRSWNHRAVRDYLGALDRGRLPTAGEERLTVDQLRQERVMLGLRTASGPALADLGPDADAALQRFVSQGLLRVDRERARPTPRGMLLCDRLAVELA